MAGASDQQSIDARDAAPLWQRLAVTLSFSETNQTLAYVGYSVPYRHRFRNVSLHCAPPGREGQPVAVLPAGEGTLSNAEIVPVYESGGCGMAIDNTASLLEALLRGNLYVLLEPNDPSASKLWGQFPVR